MWPDRNRGAAIPRETRLVAWRAGLKAAWTALVRTVRRVAGMPDYAAYVSHVRTCHPERAVPSERQFFDEYLRLRYESGPTRCC